MSHSGPDRRRPLAGISRKTFMDNAIEVFGEKSIGFWGMFYDMQRCTDSKVQLANEKIDNNLKVVTDKIEQMNNKCSDCVAANDDRYIKKFEIGKWTLPFSKFMFLIIFAAIFIALGLGILELKDIINFKWLLKL